jgi:hypothetical protein
VGDFGIIRESETQRRRVKDEALRSVNFCGRGRRRQGVESLVGDGTLLESHG